MAEADTTASRAVAPLVTLGMPAYNSERYIAASLDSLLAQDLGDFELVISDNASTDGTSDICRSYAARDARIRYLRQPRNIGAVANWNYLVHAARGTYFRWSSSNDLCAPDLLRRCVEALEADTSLVLCYGRTALIDDDGRVFEQYDRDRQFREARASARFRRACMEMHLNNAQSAVIRLRELRATGLERAFPEGDMVLMAELALHGGFRLLPEVLFYRRMGRNSTTRYMNATERAAFRDPATVGRVEYTVWPSTGALLRSVVRAPIGMRERAESAAFVLRQLWWQRSLAWRELKQRLTTRNPATASPLPVIALLGAYSSRNFGDIAIQSAAIHNLRSLCPAVRIAGISHDAVDTLQALGIEGWNLQAGEGLPEEPRLEKDISTPRLLLRRFAQWRRMHRVAKQVDLLVVSGSGQLEDYWGGPWGHAWALFAWSLAFRLRGRKVAVLATGLDDLSTRLGKMFVRAALSLASRRSFRDSGTLLGVRSIGFKGEGSVCPDLAFSLPDSYLSTAPVPKSPAVVVVCPISRRAFRHSGDEAYARYLESLRELCLDLAARGFEIHLANSQVDLDGPLLSEFAASLEARGLLSPRLQVRLCARLDDYLKEIACAQLVVASRLHALILAVVSRTPVVAISYSRKVTQLMADVGLGGACVDLETFDANQLRSIAIAQLADGPQQRIRLGATVEAFRRQLQTEYQGIAELLPLTRA